MTALPAPSVHVARTEACASLADPLRRRLLGLLGDGADSASGLARRAGMPRQKVNYHLREMEQAGLVELVEERRKRGCVERVVRASATSYVIDPAILGSLGADPSNVPDRFSSAYLIALASRTIREVAVLRERAAAARKQLPTLSLDTEVRFASAQAQHDFAEELGREVARLIDKYHDDRAPGGRRFRVAAVSYPVITRDAAGNPLPEIEEPRRPPTTEFGDGAVW